MKEDVEDRLHELKLLSEEEHSRIYKEHGCESYCECVFSEEDIERLVKLTKQPSYSVPRGLPREEKRRYMKEVNDEARPKYLLTREQVHKIGEHSLRKYAETSPSDFNPEDFINLTEESVTKEKLWTYDD